MAKIPPKDCVICGTTFIPRDRAQKALVCGPECRQIRKQRMHRKPENSGSGLNPDGSVKSELLERGYISLSSGAMSGTGSETL